MFCMLCLACWLVWTAEGFQQHPPPSGTLLLPTRSRPSFATAASTPASRLLHTTPSFSYPDAGRSTRRLWPQRQRRPLSAAVPSEGFTAQPSPASSASSTSGAAAASTASRIVEIKPKSILSSAITSALGFALADILSQVLFNAVSTDVVSNSNLYDVLIALLCFG